MTTPGPQSPLRWPFKGRLQSGQEDNLASSLVSNWVTGIVCVGSLLALRYIKTQRQAETCVIRLHHSRVSQMWQSKDEKSKTLIGRGRRKYVFWQKRFLRSLVYLYSDYCKRKCGPAYSGMLFINVWHCQSLMQPFSRACHRLGFHHVFLTNVHVTKPHTAEGTQVRLVQERDGLSQLVITSPYIVLRWSKRHALLIDG